MDLLPGIQSTASALNAERIRTDVIAQNIANAMTTRGADGHIYQRQEVLFESLLPQGAGNAEGLGAGGAEVGVRVAADSRPPRLSPDPSNPGKMIETPDINVHREMTDLILSQRAYEANLAVAKSARTMAMQTLSIGKRV
ncbi:MAG: flagellar basal body rod protein FlgC [Verrucomicrobia bacterium]|nr:flagellar basal body rod protein FlgC [Verrucomicrobiota bacterium]MBI3870334.1 flagellar basal body rod protein FlgC [Verrucomicrobiota bacterium]